PRHPALVWSGTDGNEVIEQEEKGLRIKLTPARTRKDPAGVVLVSAVKGNFEITAGYELLQAEQPNAGNGVGFELYVMLETPGQDALGLCRAKRRDGGDVYVCNHMLNRDGRRRYDTKFPPASGKSGRLRVSRQGGEVTFWAAEGPAGEFRELCRWDVGP